MSYTAVTRLGLGVEDTHNENKRPPSPDPHSGGSCLIGAGWIELVPDP